MKLPVIRPGVQVTVELAKQLQDSVAQLETEKEKADKELAASRQLVTQRDQQIKTLTADLQAARHASSELNTIKVQNQQLNRNIADIQEQLRKRDADLADREATIASAATRAAAEKSELTTQVTQLNAVVAEKDTLITRHLAEIADLKSRISQEADAGPIGKVVQLETVMATVEQQVSNAQQAMKAAGDFQLANVSVKLNAKAEDDGSKVRILGMGGIRSDLVNALDEFRFDLTPRPEVPAPAAGQVAVPDLSGMTQGAAQRVMAAAGLRLDVASGKPPSAARMAPGQAFKQSPAAGAHVDRGVAVLVVFAE